MLDPFLHCWARATQPRHKKHCSSGKSLATPYLILPARDLIPQPCRYRNKSITTRRTYFTFFKLTYTSPIFNILHYFEISTVSLVRAPAFVSIGFKSWLNELKIHLCISNSELTKKFLLILCHGAADWVKFLIRITFSNMITNDFALFLLLTSITNITHQVKYSKKQQGCCKMTDLGSSSRAVILKSEGSHNTIQYKYQSRYKYHSKIHISEQTDSWASVSFLSSFSFDTWSWDTFRFKNFLQSYF